jgi:hypothetical protein
VFLAKLLASCSAVRERPMVRELPHEKSCGRKATNRSLGRLAATESGERDQDDGDDEVEL